jgi:hypothetical protein
MVQAGRAEEQRGILGCGAGRVPPSEAVEGRRARAAEEHALCEEHGAALYEAEEVGLAECRLLCSHGRECVQDSDYREVGVAGRGPRQRGHPGGPAAGEGAGSVGAEACEGGPGRSRSVMRHPSESASREMKVTRAAVACSA